MGSTEFSKIVIDGITQISQFGLAWHLLIIEFSAAILIGCYALADQVKVSACPKVNLLRKELEQAGFESRLVSDIEDCKCKAPVLTKITRNPKDVSTYLAVSMMAVLNPN